VTTVASDDALPRRAGCSSKDSSPPTYIPAFQNSVVAGGRRRRFRLPASGTSLSPGETARSKIRDPAHAHRRADLRRRALPSMTTRRPTSTAGISANHDETIGRRHPPGWRSWAAPRPGPGGLASMVFFSADVLGYLVRGRVPACRSTVFLRERIFRPLQMRGHLFCYLPPGKRRPDSRRCMGSKKGQLVPQGDLGHQRTTCAAPANVSPAALGCFRTAGDYGRFAADAGSTAANSTACALLSPKTVVLDACQSHRRQNTTRGHRTPSASGFWVDERSRFLRPKLGK